MVVEFYGSAGVTAKDVFSDYIVLGSDLQGESKVPTDFFLTCFRNGWEFLVQILHVYFTFLSTLEYQFLLNYLQL